MSKVVLGQMGLLGPGTDDTHRSHLGQPWMSQVLLGLLELGLMQLSQTMLRTTLDPRTDGTAWTSWTWDLQCSQTMSRTTLNVPGCVRQMEHLGPGTDDAHRLH